MTPLGPGGVRHGGCVDAGVNSDANALARDIAGKSVRSFPCGKDKAVVAGKREPGFDFVPP